MAQPGYGTRRMVNSCSLFLATPVRFFRQSGTRDESRILTASEDGTARVWDAKSGAELVQTRRTLRLRMAGGLEQG